MGLDDSFGRELGSEVVLQTGEATDAFQQNQTLAGERDAFLLSRFADLSEVNQPETPPHDPAPAVGEVMKLVREAAQKAA